MRRQFLLLLLGILASTAFAVEFTDYKLNESFESGQLPEGWTQEYVSGQQSWVVESGDLKNPVGAADGQYRVALRNATDVTIGFTTRLVTKAIDLRGVFQPILVFKHAQAQRTGDFETLKVYYRDKEGDAWKLAKEYTEKITRWKEDTVYFSSTTSSFFQIAFEASDNLGYGVVLDAIRVRSLPTCDQPANITVSEVSQEKALLTWTGSFDADSFDIVVSQVQLAEVSADAEGVVFAAVSDDFRQQVTGLTLGTEYYAYIRSYCGEQITDWTEAAFATSSLVKLPYEENFNVEYQASAWPQPKGWTCGTDLYTNKEMQALPFINQGTSTSSLGNYSMDNTTSLIFSGRAGGISTVIPGENWVYAATPEIDEPTLQGVEVSFWATGGYYVGRLNQGIGGIIVGVMTDPANIETFVPVDTVYEPATYAFSYLTVNLKNYTGNGKFIAFLSRFDENNYLSIDDVKIYRPDATTRPCGIELSNITPLSFDITAETHDADSWDVIIASDAVNVTKKNTVPKKEFARFEKLTGKTNTIKFDKAPGRFLTIYVQSTKGGVKSELSAPLRVRLPELVSTYPYTLDFEMDTEPQYKADSVIAFTNAHIDYEVPVGIYTPRPMWRRPLRVTTTTISVYHGTYKGNVESNMYWVLPMVPEKDFNKISISCYISPWNAGMAGKTLEIGVMTDPDDASTFEVLGRFEVGASTSTWDRCFTSLSNYKGKGRMIAMRQVDAEATTEQGLYYIDYLQIDTLGNCTEAYGFESKVTDKTAELSWSAPGIREWQVKVGTGKSGNTLTGVFYDQKVETNKLELTGLQPHTEYYYTIASMCGDEPLNALPQLLKTACSEKEALPYKETFESYVTRTTAGIVPNCWTMPLEKSGSNAFTPYVSSSGYEGNGLYFFRKETAPYFALPEFETSNLKELELTLMAKTDTKNEADSLYVGVMTDPEDLSTFKTVAAYALTTAWQEIITNFKGYEGSGKYIAVTRSLTADVFTVDNVEVKYLAECGKVQRLRAEKLQTNGATLSWSNLEVSKYEVVILSGNDLTVEQAFAQNKNIVIDSIVEDYRIALYDDRMAVNQTYYAAVRSVCSETQRGEWSLMVSFKTACNAVTPDEYGTEDFSATTALSCWETGRLVGTSSTIQRQSTYKCLYIYHVAASDNVYAIAPAINFGENETDVTGYQASFDAHAGTNATAAKTISVGLVSDVNDLSTAVILKKFALENVSGLTAATGYGFNEALRYTVRFNTYDGDYNGNYGNRLVFLTEAGGVIEYAYIKNLSFSKTGAVAEPIEMEVKGVLDTAVTIGWEDLKATKYEVKIAETAIDPATADGKGTFTTTSNEITIGGLTSLTKYWYYVRAINGDEASVWSNGRFFTTDCPLSAKLPWSYNFDDCKLSGTTPPNFQAPECWTRYYNTHTTAVALTTDMAGVAYASAKYGTSGAGLQIGSISSTNNCNYVIGPSLSDEMLNGLLSFNYKAANATGSRTMVVGVTDVVEPYEDFMQSVTWLDTVVWSDDDSWKSYLLSFAGYTGTGRHLVLGSIDGIGGKLATAGYIYIDNIMVEKMPDCVKPDMLTGVRATTNSITIRWKDDFGEKWNVRYRESGKEEKTTLTATSTTVTIEGLTPSTAYEFEVQSDCGESQSVWVGPMMEQTLCLVEIEGARWDFDEDASEKVANFEGSSNKMTPCWMVGNTLGASNTNNPYTITNTNTIRYAYSGDYSLRIGGTAASGAYAVLPKVNADQDTLQLRFKTRMVYGTTTTKGGAETKYTVTYAAATYDRNFKIGTMDSPYEPETFDPIATHQVAVNTQTTLVDGNWWEEVVVSLYGTQNKYIAFNVDNAKTMAYIDDVVIEREGAVPAPTYVRADKGQLKPTEAVLTWKSSKSEWIVEVQLGNDVLLRDTVNETSYKATGLQPNTEYSFNIQTRSGDTGSEWRSISFTTPCQPVGVEAASWDIESDYEQFYLSGTTRYYRPSCWKTGVLKGSSRFAIAANYPPQAKQNTNAYRYSRNYPDDVTQGWALYMQSSTTVYGLWSMLPALDFGIDTMALHFYARHYYENASGKFPGATAAYPHDITIGYVTNDDISTFVAMDTVYVDLSANVTNTTVVADRTDNYWDEFTIELKNYPAKDARLVLVYAMNSPATGYLSIDDIAIVPSDFCVSPTGVRATDVTSTSATVSWQSSGVQSFEVEVALNDTFDNPVVSKTVNESRIELTNLEPAKTYYYRVRHLCSESKISDWIAAELTTAYQLAYNEDFSRAKGYNAEGWKRRSGDTGLGTTIKALYEGQLITESGDSYSGSWQLTKNDVLAGGKNAMTANTSTPYPPGMPADIAAILGDNSYAPFFLNSPNIDLAGVSDSILLSFDLALSAQQTGTELGYEAPNLTDNQEDFFAVVISEDGGQTWKEENTTKWSNKGDGKYVYNEIPYVKGGRRYAVELTPYNGKLIQICFVTMSPQTGSSNKLHLSDVRINRYKTDIYSSSICQYVDFENEDFQFDADELSVGTKEYEAFKKADKADGTDRLVTMALTVEPAAETRLTGEVCEGRVYDQYNFNIAAAASREYKRKLTGANGCDSTVVLSLTVVPSAVSMTEATICQGAYFEFCNKQYYTSGSYSDTIAAANGCDSIATLLLTVNPMLRGEDEVWLCPGTSVNFGKWGEITEGGVYTDTLKTAIGCDSVATLTVHNATAGTEVRQVAICYGETYGDGIFEGMSRQGTYTVIRQTEYGCDSTITLNLYVANADGEIEAKIGTDELPFVLNDTEVLPEGTEEGVYEEKITLLPCGEVTVVVTVGEPTGIGTVRDNGNGADKVLIDEHIYIIRNGEWYDVVGQKVQQAASVR